MIKKRGQVWVETVIYTMIAFALIGAVLGFVKPKIDELKDKSILEQQINTFIYMDSKITEAMQGAPGNSRQIQISIKKGTLTINAVDDRITFEMDSKYQNSEVGKNVDIGGGLISYTIKKGKGYFVNVTKDYKNSYDLRYNELDENKQLTFSANMYNLQVQNKEITVGTEKKIIANFQLT